MSKMATTTPQNVFPKGIKPFAERKHPKTICMFDVDGTLSLARQSATPEMQAALKKLREYTAVAFVGGSDLVKIVEQLHVAGEEVSDNFDYCFSENGLMASKLGQPLASASFIEHVGEEEYKNLVNFVLRYFSELDIPIKRGTFIEYRRGMVNMSPIGRACSLEERAAFYKYDMEHKVREKMVKILQEKFAHLGLTFAIGGQISFDVFPHGWDKTYSLKHIENEGFDQIHFFGDKTFEGGNDYEIFEDPRTIGHTVTSPEHTQQLLDELFFSKA